MKYFNKKTRKYRNNKYRKYNSKKKYTHKGGAKTFYNISSQLSNKNPIQNVTKKIKNYSNLSNVDNIIQSNTNLSIQDIKNKINKENSFEQFMPQINSSEIMDKASNLTKTLGIKAIESVGSAIGIDVTNPQQTNMRLEQIKKNLTNPQNIENIKDITSNIAELGAVGIEAAKPFIDPLVDTTIHKMSDAASKIGESGVKIALNTAEEIPGVGIFIGTLRSLSNLGEAGLSVINTGTEIMKDTSDTINATTKNFKQLIKQKQDLINRTQNSIDKFMNQTNSTKNYLMNQNNAIRNNIDKLTDMNIDNKANQMIKYKNKQ